MQPEDDPRPDPAGGAADAADWLDVVIPDDARALERDIAAYRHEQRAKRRRARLQRFLVSPWRRLGIAGPLALGIVIAIASVGSLLLMSLPRAERNRPAQQPVAPDASPGLVPDVRLDSGDVSVRLRALRPAVIALVPAACKCGRLLDTLAGQAQEFRLDLLTVGPARTREVFDLARSVRRGRAVPLVDSTNALSRRFDPVGVTALILAPDATVRAVIRDANEHTRLEPYLSAVLEPSVSAVRTR